MAKSPSDSSLKVLAIRHGETAWSLNGRHTGTTDIPLTDNGRRLAERMRPKLSKLAFVLVLCVPKARIASGGRFHPESCRLIWQLTSGLAG
jgi:hypothetical protein